MRAHLARAVRARWPGGAPHHPNSSRTPGPTGWPRLGCEMLPVAPRPARCPGCCPDPDPEPPGRSGDAHVPGIAQPADAAPARVSSPTPARRAAAGAFVVGKSTLPEFAIEGYCANDLTRVTRHPGNPALSPGRSSGGSAAARRRLGARARWRWLQPPTRAARCASRPRGAAWSALKPTAGLIGGFLEPHGTNCSTLGVLTDAADDRAQLVSIVRDPIADDPASLPRSTPACRAGARYPPACWLPSAPARGPLDPDVERALRRPSTSPPTWWSPGRVDGPEEFIALKDPDLDWYVTGTTVHVPRPGEATVHANRDAQPDHPGVPRPRPRRQPAGLPGGTPAALRLHPAPRGAARRRRAVAHAGRDVLAVAGRRARRVR